MCRVKVCSQEARHTRCGAHVLDFIDIKAIDMHNHFPRNLHTIPIRPDPTSSGVRVSRALQAWWFLGKSHVMGLSFIIISRYDWF